MYIELIDSVYAYKEQLQEEYAMEKLTLCFKTGGYQFSYACRIYSYM